MPTKKNKTHKKKSFDEFLKKNESITFSDEQQALLDHAVDKERRKKRKSDAQVRALRKELELAEDRFEFIVGLKDSIDVYSLPSVKEKGIKTKKAYPAGEATMVFVASDWHIEERVDPETVNGQNEYTLEIALDRARKFTKGCLWLLGKERKGAIIDTVVFAILGDMITGYIHEELMENNYLSPIEATLTVQKILEECIKTILDKGRVKKLIIPCCHGNHARVGLKKKIATAAKNSYEWMMYHQLRNHFKDDSRVEFVVADGYHLYLNVYDTIIRFHHGDHIRYGGGVGGITIPINKAISQWNKFKHADLDVFGHFHQFLDGGTFIVNGSLIGFNPYAISIKASYEVPRQAGFLIRPKRGKVGTFPVFVAQ